MARQGIFTHPATKSVGSEDDSNSAFLGLPGHVFSEDQGRPLAARHGLVLYLPSRRAATISDSRVVVAANSSASGIVACIGSGILAGGFDLDTALAISNSSVGRWAPPVARLFSEHPSLSMGHPDGIHTFRAPRRHLTSEEMALAQLDRGMPSVPAVQPNEN